MEPGQVDPLDLAIEAVYGPKPTAEETEDEEWIRSEENGGRGRPRPIDEKLLDAYRRSVNELNRRLANKQIAAQIPDSVLVKLVTDFAKLEAQQEERKKAKAKQLPPQTVNVLQIIRQDGLPAGRQAQIVVAAIGQARSAGDPVDHLEQALEQLVGAPKARELLALEVRT